MLLPVARRDGGEGGGARATARFPSQRRAAPEGAFVGERSSGFGNLSPRRFVTVLYSPSLAEIPEVVKERYEGARSADGVGPGGGAHRRQ